MRTLQGRTAIVTGASRGIGTYIARALAKEHMQLVLAARSAAELEELAMELRREGCQALVVPTDLADSTALEALVAAARRAFGAIDVLVNNAGTITVAAYDQLDVGQVEAALQVNLVALMLLMRMVLPGMLAQGHGHIVNISSLAGKVGAAYLEPYCAVKAGLLGVTSALRASYRASGVSASAICPGFIRTAGMYQRVQNETHIQTPPLFGASSPEHVATAVVRAITHDLPEVVVNPFPVRPLLALQALFPGLVERILPAMGADTYKRAGEIYARQAAEAHS